jgi:hypothetical protein
VSVQRVHTTLNPTYVLREAVALAKERDSLPPAEYQRRAREQAADINRLLEADDVEAELAGLFPGYEPRQGGEEGAEVEHLRSLRAYANEREKLPPATRRQREEQLARQLQAVLRGSKQAHANERALEAELAAVFPGYEPREEAR